VAREISVVDRKIPDSTADEKAKDKAFMDAFKASGNIKSRIAHSLCTSMKGKRITADLRIDILTLSDP
jgi:hypothetical protein